MRGPAARTPSRFGDRRKPGPSSDSTRVISLLGAPRRVRRRLLAAVRAELRAERERLSRA